MFFLQLLSLFTLLAFCFSVVMLLSMTGGAQDIREGLQRGRQGRYCLLMQLLYAALLAQANDPEEEMTAAGAPPEAAAAVEQRFAQLREESGS